MFMLKNKKKIEILKKYLKKWHSNLEDKLADIKQLDGSLEMILGEKAAIHWLLVQIIPDIEDNKKMQELGVDLRE